MPSSKILAGILSIVTLCIQTTFATEKLWPNPLPEEMDQSKLSEIELLLSKRKWAEAAVVLKTILSQKPNSEWANFELSKVLVHLKRREESIRLLTTIQRTAGSRAKREIDRRIPIHAKVFLTNDALMKFLTAVNQMEGKKYSEARETLKALQGDDPENVEVLLKTSQVLLVLNQTRAAQETLESARRIYPNEPEIDLAFGRVAYQLGNFEEAIGLLKTANEKLKKSELAPVWLAEALVASNRKSEAIETLEKDVQQNPNHVYSHLSLAKTILPLEPNPNQIDSKILWRVQRDLQLAIRKYPAYLAQLEKEPFETPSGFRPLSSDEIKLEIENHLQQVELRLGAALKPVSED